MANPENEMTNEDQRFFTFVERLNVRHDMDRTVLKSAFDYAARQRSQMWFFEKWTLPISGDEMYREMRRIQDGLDNFSMSLTGLLRIKSNYSSDVRIPNAVRQSHRCCNEIKSFAKLVNYPIIVDCPEIKF